ncbi:MAG TPA: hypothetical protein VIX91_24975 [Candidatus Acidoferrum sp.]
MAPVSISALAAMDALVYALPDRLAHCLREMRIVACEHPDALLDRSVKLALRFVSRDVLTVLAQPPTGSQIEQRRERNPTMSRFPLQFSLEFFALFAQFPIPLTMLRLRTSGVGRRFSARLVF